MGKLLRDGRGPIGIAIGLYWLWGALLIAQKPGLQDDEALMVVGAVHMRHSAGPFELLQTPDSWVCPLDHCIPLMSASYVGAVKEYAALPFFLWSGPRVPIVRIVSLLLAAFLIWGIYRITAEFLGDRAAALAALAIAINPAFVNMTVFDNNAVAAMMAGLGLTGGLLAIYQQRKNLAAAFALGLAIGFTVWARANSIWILAAGFIAGLIVFRQRFLAPIRHWIAMALGSLLGSAPLLAFEIISHGFTWKVQQALSESGSMATLLRSRIFWFADTLISDGEHRRMWAGPLLPQWQLWLFPCLTAAAILLCLFGSPKIDTRLRSFVRALAITSLATGASLLFSRLPVAEHHLIVLLPLAAMMIIAACSILTSAHRWMRPISAGLLLVYGSCAVYWHVAAIRGLKATGGVGLWSNSVLELARYLDQKERPEQVKYLDWGLLNNMYVLTDGRLKAYEIYSTQSEDADDQGRPWVEQIRGGGVFVLHGPDDQAYPKPTAGFLHAAAAARPVRRLHTIYQRNGQKYAQILEIEPNSIRGAGSVPAQIVRLQMSDTRLDDRLKGFYSPEGAGFRWTRREFSAALDLSDMEATGVQLSVHLYIPESILRKAGPLTLFASAGSHTLNPETWSQPGQYVYRRELEPAWIASEPVQMSFRLNKAVPPTARDQRELGIVVSEISAEPLW